MNTLICGLNGCGKTTLGRALADELGFFFSMMRTIIFSNLKLDGENSIIDNINCIKSICNQ